MPQMSKPLWAARRRLQEMPKERPVVREEKPHVEMRSPSYAGVDVNHPRIVEAITALSKQGKRVEEIAKIVGMPAEVIRKHQDGAS